MEYVQERVATLHDLTGRVPDAPTERAAVVVPMTEREYASAATEHVLSALAAADPGRVVVALRAPRERVPAFREWLDGFDLPLSVLWCNAPAVSDLLDGHGLLDEEVPPGKGRDVWLALGVAASTHEYVVVHDADARSYSAGDVPRLLAPLAGDFSFTKGYYARVEDGQLFGRLFRLFYAPLVRALADRHDAPVLDYLDSFRYALAGEFGMTAPLAERVRVPRRWGLEVGTLGEAFAHVGFDGTAQVDLGTYEHDHRAVDGPTGLSEMATHVGSALFQALADEGVRPDYATLPRRYRAAGERLVRQYAADADFNGLAYDAAAEREQVRTYADAISPPARDARLPAWTDVPFSPADVTDAALDRTTRRAKTKR